ncbi:MAG TPA: hypothetical protein PL157_21940, partial [Acidobacteriota bacterium]|nr:hypothetical protein [Acidobacteriota bacterium]
GANVTTIKAANISNADAFRNRVSFLNCIALSFSLIFAPPHSLVLAVRFLSSSGPAALFRRSASLARSRFHSKALALFESP